MLSIGPRFDFSAKPLRDRLHIHIPIRLIHDLVPEEFLNVVRFEYNDVMPTNVEYKAHLTDRPEADRLAMEGSGGPPTILVQRDTYYEVTDGRLKKREETQDGAVQAPVLIRYHRADNAGTRDSQYTLEPVEREPEEPVWLVVEKTRRFSMIGEVRIHIDAVYTLGDFIEFESLVNEKQGHAQAQATLDAVLQRFAPVLGEPIDTSYSALLEASITPGA